MFLGAAGYRSLMMYLQRYSGNFYDSYIDLLRDDTKLSYIPSGTCIPFSKKMFITVNGKILPCERIAHKYCLGYVNKDSVELNIEKIEQKYNLYFNKLKNACSVCKNQKSCIQCIFNIDSIDNEHPKCHGFMTEKEFQYICNIQEAFLRKHPEMYRKILTKSITI